jgi:two-component system NtrC family sensor kinase
MVVDGADSELEPDQAHHQRTVTALRYLTVASIVVPILMLCVGGVITWQEKRQEAFDQTIRLVDLVYESTSKLIGAQLLATEQTELMIGGKDDGTITREQPELHARLRAMLRFLPHLRDIYVIDRDGHDLVDADRYPAPGGPAVTGRDYFRYFKDGGRGQFLGSLNHRFMDGLSFIPLAIGRPEPGGSFTGLIATSIDPDYFARFFQKVLAAYPEFDGRTVSLRRRDGQILVRSEQLSDANEASAAALSAELLKSGDSSGHFVSGRLGETRMVAWRRLPDIDMAVFSSVSLRGVVRSWLATMVPYSLFGLAAALALFSITVVALHRTREAEAAERLAGEERLRRQRAEETVRQSQKMEALGKLTGGVAHDFNNLLAVIQGNAELAKLRPPDKIARLLDNVLHASHRGATLIRQLLSFSRSQALAPKVVDPHHEVTRMTEMLRPSLRGDIQVEVRVPDDVWLVEVDTGEWEIALLNIAVNARDAMPDGGWFTVDVSNRHVAEGENAGAPGLAGDFVRIALSDTGIGMPPEIAARAFEPFFTTKDVGRGTGLGLSQVYGFARQAGGAATIEPGPAGGTTVVLFLPRSDKPMELFTPAALRHEVHDRGTTRILLVEDNHEVASITIEIIETLGYEVVRVDRARKAIDLLMEPGTIFHLLLTDVVMPDGMNGLQLARMVRARLPVLPIILVSGYNDAVIEEPAAFRMLRKPLPVDQLAQAIRAELGTYPRVVVDNVVSG